MRLIMRSTKYFSLTILTFLGIFFGMPLCSETQDSSKLTITEAMREAYGPFVMLQSYLLDSKEFESEENQEKLLKIVKSLNHSFHFFDSDNSKYAKIPGFRSILFSLKNMLNDTENALQRGNTSWSYWRTKTIANHCSACHTSFAPHINFIEPIPIEKELDSLQKGEFYLATRQFDKAREAFYEAASSPSLPQMTLEALRKWLIINVRVSSTPNTAQSKLEDFYENEDKELIRYEKEVIENWIESLKSWNAEPKQKDSLEEVERLLKTALREENHFYFDSDEIQLLRATAILHRLTAQSDFTGAKRRRALYLLGVSYSQLKLFFINELPEIYLEQCIWEYPDTQDARKAYGLLRDVLTLGFSGSGGTHIPDDVNLRLKELHDRAYGIPIIEGRAYAMKTIL